MQLTEHIHGVEGQGYDSNMYLLIGDRHDITLIDTGHDGHRRYLIKYIEKIGLSGEDIKDIILTHVHVDHSGGLSWLVEEYGSRVHVFEGEADYIESGDMNITLAGMMGGYFDKTKVDDRMVEGSVYKVANHEFKILHTPGHTAGSICLFDRQNKILISGDTVFADGSFGRTDFPGGDTGALRDSLDYLASLDVEVLLPGHMRWVTSNAGEHLKKSAKFIRMVY
ncbi:MAG: MBL fold metallo-hydrolase [Promethearchaeota archaeon]